MDKSKFGLGLHWLPRSCLDRQNETYTLDLSECRFRAASHRYGAGRYRLNWWLGLVLIQITFDLGSLKGHWGQLATCTFLLLALASRVLPWPHSLESPRMAPAPVQTGFRLAPIPQVVPWRQSQPPGYTEAVVASFYGPGFGGKKMANGDFYDPNRMLAASLDLPLGSWALVCRQDLCCVVQIVDRGPFPGPDDPRRGSRAIDLGERPAHLLGMEQAGLATVTIQPIPAPILDGDAGRCSDSPSW